LVERHVGPWHAWARPGMCGEMEREEICRTLRRRDENDSDKVAKETGK
jgi:hypothetical protein